MKRLIFVIPLFFALIVNAHAGNDPMLVIDTGGHKALVRDVIFTKDGRHLVSASNDKTVRVWDVRTGRISRIIRGWIGDGHEGKIYAAALSPDNEWLAVGGWMGPTVEYTEAVGTIRLYHFPTGRLTGLLKGHTNVISSLAFSKDNRFLASGSSDDTVRIWNVEKQTRIHKLTGHKDDIYALPRLPDSRRVASGSDDSGTPEQEPSNTSLKAMTGVSGA